MRARARTLAVLLVLAAGSVLARHATAAPGPAPGAAPGGRPQAPPGRVVVLGFDGADHRTVQALLDAGELPNIARLAAAGTFAPLRSTHPAESAAAWAALNTGRNPGKTGVPSFVGRALFGSTVLPVPAHTGTATRPIGALAPPGLLGALAGQDAALLAGAAGLGAALLAFALARTLRARTAVALGLAAVLGGAGAWAARLAAGWVPVEVPGITTNRIEADGFWSVLGEAGVRTIALDAAMAFDRPDVPNARVLAGLGLPDARGDYGDYFLYTTDDPDARPWPEGSETTTTAGNVYRVAWDGDRIETRLSGPVDFWERGRVRARIDAIQRRLLDVDPRDAEAEALRARQQALKAELDAFDGAGRHVRRAHVGLDVERLGPGRARVTIDGQAQELDVGEWSDVYAPRFELNPLVSARAVTRARLLRLDGGLELMVGILSIDPRAPAWWQPVSRPAGFAAELADWIGAPYPTVGWACLTNPMKDARLPADAFLADVETNFRAREALTRAALARDDWDVLFSVFTTPDRVQHLLYRHLDPAHPRHDPAEAAREVRYFGRATALRDAIPETYRQMDRLVGEVAGALREGDVLLLCADHGFASFRREVHVNNWLAERGFLAVRADAGAPGPRRLDATAIDWSRTQAYAVGLGGVWLNLQGRERMGIVAPGRAADVLAAIRAAFLGTVEPGPDGVPVRVGADAVSGAALYSGAHTDRCPDLLLGFAEGYRASWATARGEIVLAADAQGRAAPGPAVQDNLDAWSGDHASVAPEVVTGLFLSSEPVVVPPGGISVLHVAPTILDRMGVPIPDDYDEAPLARR